MTQIIDVSYPCEKYVQGLRRAGVKTVIRYYSRDSAPSAGKRLHPPEAAGLAAAGLRIGIVYEGKHGNDISYFNRDVGVLDGDYARSYAQQTIGQPAGSTIYFGVDTDADPRRGKDEVNKRVIPYFQGIAEAFTNHSGGSDYVVGVYGSGAVCEALLDAGLVRMTWLAQSTGWSGYQKFLASGRWNLLQALDTVIAEVKCDPNTAGAGMDIGDFVLGAPVAATGQPHGLKFVNARSGVRLRAGPGVDFAVLSLLPYATSVKPWGFTDDWTLVDLQGVGASDGYISTGYLDSETIASAGLAAVSTTFPPTPLMRVSPTSFTGLLASSSADAPHIPVLIQNGNSADALAAARATAAGSMSGYPTNGCAAHLSALLRQSGINVPMTLGAGMLATRMANRGWQHINVGNQQPGDIGVCFDKDTSIPGADHIYLVVEALDQDKMLIADNQNKADAPHARSARGLDGRTATDYFLRA